MAGESTILLPLGEGQGEGLAGTPELVHPFFLFVETPYRKRDR